MAGKEPLKVTVVDRDYALPDGPDLDYRPRPEDMRASSFRPTDMSLVRSEFVF
jgi:hypothetical protein